MLTIITNSISGLTPGQTNYFAFYASNATDTAWAFASFVSTPQTAVIKPYRATASSTFDAIRVIEKTIDSSGLTAVGDVSTWTHDNGEYTYWMATVASNAVLTYSLPGVADVDGVYLWQNLAFNRALNTFDISFSTDNGVSFANTVSGLSLVVTNITQTCSFPRKSGVTHIRLSNLTSSDTYVNLGEIRFRRAGPPAGTVIIVR